MIRNTFIIISLITFCFIASCGGGSSGGAEPSNEGPSGQLGDDGPTPELDPSSDSATYRIQVENYWTEKDFPQGYPDDAHLSFFGGAVHNQAVSFWSFGEPPSPGIEDMAERGHIDILLQEVAVAIKNGTADSAVDVRKYTYTKPATDGESSALVFDVVFKRGYPLLSLTSMLGPSPDWFVGVDELSLLNQGKWLISFEEDLPLYDGGSKSNMTPVMHGPGISPPDPISYVAYDQATGVYLPTDTPQIVAKMIFTRIK